MRLASSSWSRCASSSGDCEPITKGATIKTSLSILASECVIDADSSERGLRQIRKLKANDMNVV